MEITGKIALILDEQSGTSKAGNPWKKQLYIMDTEENFPRKVCFTVFGSDRVDQFRNAVKPGDRVQVSVDIESREFNGRWYTDVNAWKIAKLDGSAPVQQPAPQHYDAPAAAPMSATPIAPASPDEELPF